MREDDAMVEGSPTEEDIAEEITSIAEPLRDMDLSLVGQFYTCVAVGNCYGMDNMSYYVHFEDARAYGIAILVQEGL